MNFYQSGYYEGTIEVDGRRYEIEPVAGFRDRGWGMRKHEGAPRRGFVLFAALEFADAAMWLLLYESASGKRQFTNGWLAGPDGIRDTVTALDHRLELDGTTLRSGALDLEFASGARRSLDVHGRRPHLSLRRGLHGERGLASRSATADTTPKIRRSSRRSTVRTTTAASAPSTVRPATVSWRRGSACTPATGPSHDAGHARSGDAHGR